VCDDLIEGEFVNFVTDDRVEITQDGSRIRLRRVANDGISTLIYKGSLERIVGAVHVEALVSICGGTYVAQEMVRLRRVLTDEDGSGLSMPKACMKARTHPGSRKSRSSGPASGRTSECRPKTTTFEYIG
jgi:hypothetical protein